MRGTASMMSSIAGNSGSVWARLFLLRCRRQRPRALLEVNLAPAHAANFLPAAPGQDQQLDAAAMVVVAARLPDAASSASDSTRSRGWPPFGVGGADHRVGLDEACLHRPDEQRGQLSRGRARPQSSCSPSVMRFNRLATSLRVI